MSYDLILIFLIEKFLLDCVESLKFCHIIIDNNKIACNSPLKVIFS